jgi:hypothetical protein
VDDFRGGAAGGAAGFVDGEIAADPYAAAQNGRRSQYAQARSLVASRPGQPVKGTYLGLSTSPAQAALQKQLQLKAGVGLVVDSVDAGSPAEKAGVKEFDILHKLDDQLLVNTEQLGVLVRTYPAGKDVTLTVIREGKPQTLTAKLTERELPQLHVYFRDAGAQMQMQGLIAAEAKGNAAIQYIDLVNPLARKVNGAANEVLTTVEVPDGGTVLLRSPDGKSQIKAAQVMIENAKHRMTVSKRDGHRHLKVQDKAGKVLFDGPIDTKEDLDKVPADLRQAYTEVLQDYTRDVATTQPAKK